MKITHLPGHLDMDLTQSDGEEVTATCDRWLEMDCQSDFSFRNFSSWRVAKVNHYKIKAL